MPAPAVPLTKMGPVSENSSLTASAEGEHLFELLTAEVIGSLASVRAMRTVAAATAGWCARVRCRRAKHSRLACATDMARWSCMHSHFCAILEHQRVRASERLSRALAFWRISVLQNVFCAWGPDYKWRLAERIGEGDRLMRRAVHRFRLRATFDLWSVWGSNDRRGCKERCPVAVAAVLRYSYLRRRASHCLLLWKSDASWRSRLRVPVEKLRVSATRRCMSSCFVRIRWSVHGCPMAHCLAQLITQRKYWLLWREDCFGLALRDSLPAKRRRSFIRCWRGYTAHWLEVAERCRRFRQAWNSIRDVLTAKQMLQCWLDCVLRERVREADLESLLEFFNKDVEIASKRLSWATCHWSLVAGREATEKHDKASGHARMSLRRRVMQGWHSRAAFKKRQAERRGALSACCCRVLNESRMTWQQSRVLDHWHAICLETRPFLAQTEALVTALLRRRALHCKQHALQHWRSAMLVQAALELANVGSKKLLCEVFGMWCLLLEDASILYPQLWLTAVKRDAAQRKLGALLALGLHHYRRVEREADVAMQWGVRWRDRCWRRWKHVHNAILELRAHNLCLEDKAQQHRRKLSAAIASEALHEWLAAAHDCRHQRLATTLDQRWQQRVVLSALRCWRQRAAWWSDSFLLKSYRAPEILARWSKMRVSAALVFLRPAFCAILKYAARTKSALRKADEMASGPSDAALCARVFSFWVQARYALPLKHSGRLDAAKRRVIRHDARTNVHESALEETRARLVRWFPADQHPFRLLPPPEQPTLVVKEGGDGDLDGSNADDAELSVCDEPLTLVSEHFPVQSPHQDDVNYGLPRTVPPQHCLLEQGPREEEVDVVRTLQVVPATPPRFPLREFNSADTPDSSLSRRSKAETVERPCQSESSEAELHHCSPQPTASVLSVSWKDSRCRRELSIMTASEGAAPSADLSSSHGIGVLMSDIGLVQAMQQVNPGGQNVFNPFSRKMMPAYYPTTLFLDEFLRLPASDSFLQHPLLIKTVAHPDLPRHAHDGPGTWRGSARGAREDKTSPLAMIDGAAALACLARLFPQSLRSSLLPQQWDGCTESERAQEHVEEKQERTRPTLVIQRYVENPLLLDGRRFELHAFVLVARSSPLLCFYHDGWLTVQEEPYVPPWSVSPHGSSSECASEHLTSVDERKPKTSWTFDRLRKHLNMLCRSPPCSKTHAQQGVMHEQETFGDVLEERVKPQIKGALRHAILGVLATDQSPCQPRGSHSCVGGAAEGIPSIKQGLTLLAANFIVDHHLDVHLIAFQADPDIHVSSSKEVESNLRFMVKEAINITREASRPALPEAAGPFEWRQVGCVEGFEYLYDQVAERQGSTGY